MNKNEIYEVLIEDISNDGEGIGHFEDKNGSGKIVVFVKDTAVGDYVKIKLIKCKKKYAFGKLIEIITPSLYRVAPVCEKAASCGGCAMMHMSYEKQLEYKFNKVKNCLSRIGGVKDVEKLMEPIYGMKEPYHYRNKMQFPVGLDKEGNVTIGFYAGRTHSIIDLKSCAIAHPVNDFIVKNLRQWLGKWQEKTGTFIYNETTNKGLVRHILTRVGFTTGELMVCIVINGKKYPDEACEKELIEAVEKSVNEYNNSKNKADLTISLESLCYNINTENTNKILGKKGGVTYKNGFISDYIGDVKFNISPMSFYQVNPAQTKVLYDKALEYAELSKDEVVWDMYCGIGTISLFLAKNAKKVYGVEIVPQAIEDAEVNAKINNIDNVEFICGKAEDVKIKEAADIVVVDPPRKGCDSALLDTISNMNPKRLVYVSCDPATLARDVAYLRDKGFNVQKVSVVDQFGHSTHVETVVALHRTGM